METMNNNLKNLDKEIESFKMMDKPLPVEDP